MKTNQCRAPLCGSLPLGGSFNHSKAWYRATRGQRQVGATRIAQSLQKCFKIASPKLFTLLCLAFPSETPVKSMAQALPSSRSFFLLTCTGASPCGPARYAVLPVFQTCESDCVSWSISCLLLRLHLTDHHIKRTGVSNHRHHPSPELFTSS